MTQRPFARPHSRTIDLIRRERDPRRATLAAFAILAATQVTLIATITVVTVALPAIQRDRRGWTPRRWCAGQLRVRDSPSAGLLLLGGEARGRLGTSADVRRRHGRVRHRVGRGRPRPRVHGSAGCSARAGGRSGVDGAGGDRVGGRRVPGAGPPTTRHGTVGRAEQCRSSRRNRALRPGHHVGVVALGVRDAARSWHRPIAIVGVLRLVPAENSPSQGRRRPSQPD